MSSAPLLNLPPNLPAEIANTRIVDLRGQIPVNPVTGDWAAWKGNRKLSEINTIVCHHCDYPKEISAKWTDVQLIHEIAIDHIKNKKNQPQGDPGFPYDAYIRNGTVYICNDLLPTKYGVANNNGYTIHICVSGDYTQDTLEQRDREALYAAIFLYKSQMASFKEVCGHKEITATSCPGYDMVKVRTDIGNITKSISLNDALDSTPNANLQKVYNAYTRFIDLYTIAQKAGPNQAEANRKCLQIADAMDAAGIMPKK